MIGKLPRSGAVVDGVDWTRWSVILCKPDCGARRLTETVLSRLSLPGLELSGRTELTVAPWQIHVHYWDLLVDKDSFPGRDILSCLDAEYVGRTVTVALAYGPPGVHPRLRAVLGHFDPARAADGTIRGDHGDDSLDRAVAERRLIRNLVHTSDDPEAARRDFGTWYGAARRNLLVPHQRTTA